MGGMVLPAANTPLRVAAYVRVSTDKEDQRNSLSAQRQFFQDYISGHPGWSLAGIFADEGLSGTSAKRRPRFQRLIRLALDGHVDLILTKEVSRFARNTVDTLQVTRQLKERGIGVLFLNDNLNTLDDDGEFRLTIMASVAQEESRKISERTRWGQTQALKRGVAFGNSSICGYSVERGRLTVRPDQAETVRRIFRDFAVEHQSAYAIAKALTDERVPPPLRPEGPWSTTAVLKILKNEKYTGDLLQRKYRTTDHLSHRKVVNDGAEEQYLLRDHHEPIVSRELFDAAQAELVRRSPAARGGERYSARYWWSGRVRCGLCGHSFALKRRQRRRGGEYRCFECRGRLNGHGCTARAVNYQVVLAAVRAVLGQLALDREAILGQLLDELRSLREQDREELKQALRRQKARRDRALEAFLDGGLSREDMRRVTGNCDGEIARLEEQLRGLETRRGGEYPGRREVRALLERELEGGDAVLEAVVQSVEVFSDHFIVTLAGFPVRFQVRAHGVGTGAGYRVVVDGCAPVLPRHKEPDGFPTES